MPIKQKIMEQKITSKPMAGGSVKPLESLDTVGEIQDQHILGTKPEIDRGAERFWAKRGMQDPNKNHISYGRFADPNKH